jgi:hypothetical protein
MLSPRKRNTLYSFTLPNRSSKALQLPLDEMLADKLSLRFRLALEGARQGRADLAAAHCLLEVTLLTGFLKEDGHSTIEQGVIDHAELALYKILEDKQIDDACQFDEQTLHNLTIVVNEHDRQLRELRLIALSKAVARLEQLLKCGD